MSASPYPAGEAVPARLRPWRGELGSLVKLALPVTLVQVGLMAMGMVDTLMVGRVSPQAIAAVAMGHLYSWVFLAFAMGALVALR